MLSRATTILAGLFMITSLALTVVQPEASGVLDQVPEAAASPMPAERRPRHDARGARGEPAQPGFEPGRGQLS